MQLYFRVEVFVMVVYERHPCKLFMIYDKEGQKKVN